MIFPGDSRFYFEQSNLYRLAGLDESLAEVIKMLGDAGVRSLVSQPPTLEELFLRHYDISDTGDTASDDSQQVSA